MTFRFLPHTADIKLVARARTKSLLFNECARALCAYVSDGRRIVPHQKKRIVVTGDDDASLLYQFLDELISLLDSTRFLTVRADITFKDNALHALCHGIRVPRDSAFRHVKAATYAEMKVTKIGTGWNARVVLDV